MSEITWASRITELRDHAKLTLAEIGEMVGLAPSSVSDIEQGRTKEPKGEAALRLYELHKSKSRELTRRRCAG